jgi:hypothetical protein
VSDNETKRGEDLSSEFHNDLYTFNFTNRRWFAAQLRPPKDYKQQQEQQEQQQEGGSSGEGAGAGQQQQQLEDGGQQRAAAAAAAASSSRQQQPPANKELQGLIAAGQDKNSAIYKAAVRIQSRFRCVCLLSLHSHRAAGWCVAA